MHLTNGLLLLVILNHRGVNHIFYKSYGFECFEDPNDVLNSDKIESKDKNDKKQKIICNTMKVEIKSSCGVNALVKVI